MSDSKILLTGGTGQLGKMLLKQMDHEYFQTDVLTRNKITDSTKNISYVHADLVKPETLDSLKTDYDSIIHCASDPQNSESIDVEGTRNLLKEIKDSAVRHFIYISIVGVDQSNYPYYKNKLKAEELIVHSGIPYTILRSTQFHDFIYDRILSPGENKIIEVPEGLEFQSIDLTDVCEEILRLLKSGAANSIVQIGGPEIVKITDIVETYESVMIPEKKISMVAPKNDFQKLFTTGINLCANHKVGKITWKYFLLKRRNSNPVENNEKKINNEQG